MGQSRPFGHWYVDDANECEIDDIYRLMGLLESTPQSKSSSKISQHQVLNESSTFLQQEQLCMPSDEMFQSLRLVTAKIILYGHRHLLQHVRRASDRNKKIQFLNQWRSIQFQNLDLLFQNLIRKKIMRDEEEQIFSRVDLLEKYAHLNEPRGRDVYVKGEELMRKGKVGVIIFVGSSSTKGEETFNKEFYKSKPTDSCLFEIIMDRLREIGDRYTFPPTYIFYNANNYTKISQFLKSFKYGNKITICLQSTHPILNINGNLCLKSHDIADVIQLPNGSGDFYHASIKGVSILQKLKMDNVQFISCVDCENILEQVIDPYVLGVLSINRNEFDLMYKCTYPEDQREKIFRRVVLKNNVPKADTLQALNTPINNSKHRIKNNQNVFSSPVWMNSVLFDLQKVSAVLQNANQVSSFPQTVNYTMKYMDYWSPIDNQWHRHEASYVFEREISDLMINSLFKSQAVMVEREEEYLPVISEKQEHSWESAYRQYLAKKGKRSSMQGKPQPLVDQGKPQPLVDQGKPQPLVDYRSSQIAVQAKVESIQ